MIRIEIEIKYDSSKDDCVIGVQTICDCLHSGDHGEETIGDIKEQFYCGEINRAIFSMLDSNYEKTEQEDKKDETKEIETQ